MKKLLILLLLSKAAMAQEPMAYRLFDSNGKPVTFQNMMKDLSKKEVILFGEYHDNPIAHYLQLQGLLYLQKYFRNGKVAVGMEMLERHQREVLNHYLANKNYRAFKDSTSLWPNFKTDYKPVVDSASSFGMDVFAANITRKYASLVFKNGLNALDSLSPDIKAELCPLPFPFDSTLSQYRELIDMGKSMHGSGLDFAYAQAIKDATMAYWITNYLKTNQRVYFLNGSFHSDFYQGIYWYILQYRPGTTIGTIATVEQASVRKLEAENKGRADYILVVDPTMTKTH